MGSLLKRWTEFGRGDSAVERALVIGEPVWIEGE
jgi:hypothetical protein